MNLLRRAADALGAFRSVFANRPVRLLMGAWAAALFSGWAFTVLSAVVIYEAGGAGLVGAAVAIKTIPAAIAAPLIATVADRRSQKLVLATAGAGLAVVLALATVVLALDAGIGIFIALGAVGTILLTALQPAMSSLLPRLTKEPEELTAANVASSAIESVSMFAGPAIAGLMLGVVDSWVVAAGTSAAFALAALLAARLPSPQASDTEADEDEEPEAGPIAQVMVGVREARADPGIRTLLGLFTAQTFVDGLMSVLLVVTALEILGTGETGVGLLNSAVGIGALIGTLAAAGLVGRRLAPGFAAGMVLWGVPIALLVAFPQEGSALLLFGILGVGNVLIDVAGYTMLQRAAPEKVLARIFGLLEGMIFASIALGGLLAPVMLDVLGRDAAFIITGAILPVLALLSYRRLAAIDRAAPAPAEALAVLKKIPLFAPLGAPALEELAARSTREEVAEGAAVFDQGDPGELFYVVVEGSVEVLVDGKRARVERPGEYFGEIALLREVPRTATVVALEATSLLALDGAVFVAALSGHAPSRDEADAVVATRLAAMRPAIGSF